MVTQHEYVSLRVRFFLRTGFVQAAIKGGPVDRTYPRFLPLVGFRVVGSQAGRMVRVLASLALQKGLREETRQGEKRDSGIHKHAQPVSARSAQSSRLGLKTKCDCTGR